MQDIDRHKGVQLCVVLHVIPPHGVNVPGVAHLVIRPQRERLWLISLACQSRQVRHRI
jgi:hypothetical protein